MNITNSTNSSVVIFITTLAPGIGMCRIAILITSFFLNSMVLSVYLVHPKLRTPFSIYVIVLLISNILDLVLYFPFMIANNLGTEENRYIVGEAGCPVFAYGVTVIRCSCLCSHALITVNRIWAMRFPFSYKRIHGKRFALALCLGVFVGIHIFFVPGLIQNEKHRPRPVEKFGCFVNANQASIVDVIGYILFYILPLATVATYPYLFYTYLRVKKRVFDGTAGAASQAKASRTFGIVSLLSLCTIVCWMPEELVTILGTMVVSTALVRANTVVSLISSFQVLLDPFFLLVSAEDLRNNFLRMFCHKKFVKGMGETVNVATLSLKQV